MLHLISTNESPYLVQELFERFKTISEVEVAQMDVEWIKRFYGYIALGERIAFALALLLGAGVLLIIGNTIRLNNVKFKIRN